MSGSTSLNTVPSHVELPQPALPVYVVRSPCAEGGHKRGNVFSLSTTESTARAAVVWQLHMIGLLKKLSFTYVSFTAIPGRRGFHCIPKFYLSFPFAASVQICFPCIQSASSTFPYITVHYKWNPLSSLQWTLSDIIPLVPTPTSANSPISPHFPRCHRLLRPSYLGVYDTTDSWLTNVRPILVSRPYMPCPALIRTMESNWSVIPSTYWCPCLPELLLSYLYSP